MPTAVAKQIIEEELGMACDKVFMDLSGDPVAAASLGQVLVCVCVCVICVLCVCVCHLCVVCVCVYVCVLCVCVCVFVLNGVR